MGCGPPRQAYQIAFDAPGLATASTAPFKVSPGKPIKLTLLDDYMDRTECTLERYGLGDRISRLVQCIDTYGNLCRMQENILDGGPELTIYAGLEATQPLYPAVPHSHPSPDRRLRQGWSGS